MMDILSLGILVAFFAVTWGLARACEALADDTSGADS
jgi:hypothetical protein